jgi:dTDP-4-dehydrorhamnose reductase
MRILVTGASGLAGLALVRAARARGSHVTGAVHGWIGPLPGVDALRRVDLAHAGSADRLWSASRPDVVLHAAAVSEPHACAADPEGSRRVNVGLPQRLARLCREAGVPLVHLSTDQVFDGRRGGYGPGDPLNPVSEYGRQKREAEEAVLAAHPGALILRLPLLCGNSPAGRRSLHEKLFLLWRTGAKARLFTDEFRQPCDAGSAAEASLALVERGLSGIFHWAGAEVLTRHELGRRLAVRFGLDPDRHIDPVRLAETAAAAERPARLDLEIDATVEAVGLQPESFSEQLEKMRIPPQCEEWLASAQV